jgi:hypothetical protein
MTTRSLDRLAVVATVAVLGLSCAGRASTPDATGSAGHDGGAGSGGDGGRGGGGAAGITGTGGIGGTAGTGGESGRGGSAGSAGGGGSSSGTCVAGGACTPGTTCGSCDRGGTAKLACNCYVPPGGHGQWSCGTQGPCGSNRCGPAGGSCDPRYDTACDFCETAGARHSCQCVGSGQSGTWSCAASAGACGINCGTRKCLGGEICVVLGRFPGTLPPDGGSGAPSLTPTCSVVPDDCGSQPPSCAACIISAFGCSIPGVCTDVGAQTFQCILGGA